MKTRQMMTIGIVSLFMMPLQTLAFFDVAETAYDTAIQGLFNRGIIEGYNDGTFRPEATINRAEFLKILMESRFSTRTPRDLRCFKDLDVKTPQWYAQTTCNAFELGIVSGYPDQTFRPDQPVILAEALKMALRSFQIPIRESEGAWYEPYLSAARSRGILLKLLGSPGHRLTRGEMASLTYALTLEAEDAPKKEVSAGMCGNGMKEAQEQCDDGNTEDSDGCSSICLLVTEPVRIAFLQIDQQTTGSLQSIAQGQKNVSLLKFTAVAGRQNAVLTSITLKPSIGSLLYGKHYTLAMDRDGDGVYENIVQTEGKVTNGQLFFDEFFGGGVVLPEGLIVPFLIRADLASTLGPVSLGLEFATEEPDFIEAQGAVDGIELEGIEINSVCVPPHCFIRVNTMGSHDINVQTRGNLYITEDSVPTRSHILLGGSTTPELLRLRLYATGEPIDLKTIHFDGVPASVDSLILFQSTSLSPIAQASHGQCPEQVTTRFCANMSLRTIIISPTKDTILTVVARLKTDQGGAKSGQQMALSLSTDTIHPSFTARGISSGQELLQNDGDSLSEGEIFVGRVNPGANIAITGKIHDISFATISSITRDGPVAQKTIPSGLQNIGGFKISASPHTNTYQGSNAVVINTITFHVTAQNVQLDPLSIKLALRADPSISLPCTASASTGVFTVTCTGLKGVIQDRIEQGQYAIYQLYANVTNTQIIGGSSSLSIALKGLGQRGVNNSIRWLDEVTTFQWVDIPESIIDGTIFHN